MLTTMPEVMASALVWSSTRTFSLLPIAGFPVLPTPCDIYNALSPHASKSHDLPRSSANAAGAQREKCHPKRTSKQSHDSQTTIIVNEQITTEPLLLTTTRVQTFFGTQLLTGAGSFFFEREGRLFLVTSRHVLIDPPTNHHPDRIEIELHTHSTNLTFRPVGQCCCIATARKSGVMARTSAARSICSD